MLGYKAADAAIMDILKERHREECSCIMWDAVVTKSRLQSVLTMDGGVYLLIAILNDNAGVVCQTDGGKKDKYLLHCNRTNINKSKAII